MLNGVAMLKTNIKQTSNQTNNESIGKTVIEEIQIMRKYYRVLENQQKPKTNQKQQGRTDTLEQATNA